MVIPEHNTGRDLVIFSSIRPAGCQNHNCQNVNKPRVWFAAQKSRIYFASSSLSSRCLRCGSLKMSYALKKTFFPGIMKIYDRQPLLRCKIMLASEMFCWFSRLLSSFTDDRRQPILWWISSKPNRKWIVSSSKNGALCSVRVNPYDHHLLLRTKQNVD